MRTSPICVLAYSIRIPPLSDDIMTYLVNSKQKLSISGREYFVRWHGVSGTRIYKFLYKETGNEDKSLSN